MQTYGRLVVKSTPLNIASLEHVLFFVEFEDLFSTC